MLEHGLAGRLQHFTVDLARLDACADEVVATIRQAYPDLDIPFHARWRHFAAGGIGRWGAVMQGAPWEDAGAMARAAFDLAIVSVLLDAGAGAAWRYEEGRTGELYTRSDWGSRSRASTCSSGGAFSSRPDDTVPRRRAALAGLSGEELARLPGRPQPLVGRRAAPRSSTALAGGAAIPGLRAGRRAPPGGSST
jgi:hypothetical protein